MPERAGLHSARLVLACVCLVCCPALIGGAYAFSVSSLLSSQSDLTPLHHAADSGNVEVAKALLEKGADPEAKGKVRKTCCCSARCLLARPPPARQNALLAVRCEARRADRGARRSAVTPFLCSARRLG